MKTFITLMLLAAPVLAATNQPDKYGIVRSERPKETRLLPYLYANREAIAQALEDAERYRWLRDGPPKIEWPTKKFPTPPWCVCVDKEVGLPTTRPIFGSELDAAIDTVRAKEQGK